MEGTASYVPVLAYLAETAPDAPFTLVDIGCSGGIDGVWRALGARLRALAIDPNIDEIERLVGGETHPGIRYLAAHAAAAGGPTLPGRAVERRPLNHNPWDRFSVVKSLDLMKSCHQTLPPEMGSAAVSAETRLSGDVVAVPSYLAELGIDSVDFLKIDVDGADFEVLTSLARSLENLDILGVGIEVNYFGSGSDTEPAFHNVDRFMKARGFEIFGTSVRRYSLAALPSRYLWSLPAEGEFGRPFQGDALYVRDLGSPEYEAQAARLPAAKLLNLIGIFAAFNLPDCAAEIAVRFRERLSAASDVDRILDLLATQAQGPVDNPMTYREYLGRFESQDRMFFPPAPTPPKGPDHAVLARLRSLGWEPRVIFDVGASNGSWSESIAPDFPDARYYLFEPLAGHVPEYVHRLPHVLQEHRQFTLHQVALGDRIGETTALWFPNYFASTTLPLDDPGHSVQRVPVPLTTLDNLVGPAGLPCPNLLKIDVQGSEMAILEGAQEVLPQVDVLLLETWVWRGYEGKAPLLFDLVTWLAERSFFLWDIAGQYRDHADLLTGIDCFFVNTQKMTPYLDSRAYHPALETEASKLKKVLALAREDSARLADEIARLQGDLHDTIETLGLARGRIEAMESTRFWKMRRGWFRFKRAVGLPADD